MNALVEGQRKFIEAYNGWLDRWSPTHPAVARLDRIDPSIIETVPPTSASLAESSAPALRARVADTFLPGAKSPFWKEPTT